VSDSQTVDLAALAAGGVDGRLRDRASEVRAGRDGGRKSRVVAGKGLERRAHFGSTGQHPLGEQVLREEVVVGDEAHADLPERAAFAEQAAQRAQVAQLRLQPRVAEEVVDPDLDGVDLVGHVLDVMEGGAGEAGGEPVREGRPEPAASRERSV